MTPSPYVKLATVPNVQAFIDYCSAHDIRLPADEELLPATRSPLAASLTVGGISADNRFAIQPMEGWDGDGDGFPTENTVRRWIRFGESGAGIVWGGEAVAVRPDGRANPNQLLLHRPEHKAGIARLKEALLAARRNRRGTEDGLVVGLQLTHSGRFCRPTDKKRLEPKILYRHPLLDRKFGLPDDHPLLSDGEIRAIIEEYVRAAAWAADLGFHFVDLKQSHGYLGHEFLSATTRGGDYGGSLHNRARFIREIVQGIRSAAPGLAIGVRISAFDLVPFKPDPDLSVPGRLGPGIPEKPPRLPYRHAFGADPWNPTEIDLIEPIELVGLYRDLGIRLLNITGGSPYYNPHVQRPAWYPPSDGYAPPEDPLVGVARQIDVTRRLKEQFPEMTIVGSAYTYLQDFLPYVAQAAVRLGWVDSVGLGRMVLAYPWLPEECLSGEPIRHRIVCRTFSDCTTAPRNALVSGCYPLDPHYKESPEAAALMKLKIAARRPSKEPRHAP